MYGADRIEFNEKLKKGQRLLRTMAYQCKLEMRRLWRTMPGTAFNHMYPLMDDYFQSYYVDSPRVNRLWTWGDATKIVDYYTLFTMRNEKYGLDLVNNMKTPMTKDELKEKEDELVEYFLHEMRKEPVK